MTVYVTGVDLSSFWCLRWEEGHWWLALGPWLEEIGLHASVAPTLKALMLCSETECIPFPLTEPNPLAREWEGQWWVQLDAFGKALQGEWEVAEGGLNLILPPVPLPLPLSVGSSVPDMLFYQPDGILRRLSDWSGQPVVLVLTPSWGPQTHPCWLPIVLTLMLRSLPEGHLADPFALPWFLFGDVPAVGISGDLKWEASFHHPEEALFWLSQTTAISNASTRTSALALLVTAWVGTKRDPEDPNAWLAMAEVQRLYCGLDAAVASYERAAQLGSSWARWRWGVAHWLRGDPMTAQKIWEGGALPEVVREQVLLLRR